MRINALWRNLATAVGRNRLQSIFIIPFVLQIVGTVSLVGYLSFKAGQQAVDDLVAQLVDDIGSRIDQHLDSYLATPQQINQLNLAAIELELVSLQDFETLGHLFWKQMQVFDVGYVNYANEQGEFIGVERLDDGTLLINEARAPDVNQLFIYDTDEQGQRATFEVEVDEAPIQAEGWYADAAVAGTPVWSDIYQWDDKPEVLSVSASYPIYDGSDRLIGVMGADLILSQISRFLQALEISPSTEIFIVEADGAMIAGSSKRVPYSVTDGNVERLNILAGGDGLSQAVANYLAEQPDALTGLLDSALQTFEFNGERQFIQIVPWQDQWGLDWRVILIVPESDFMAQIQANTRTTTLVCFLAFWVSILLGLSTARWVTRPILKLNETAKAITTGNLEQTIEIDRQDELGELADSFTQMIAQLQASFTQLKTLNADLSESEQRLALVNQTLEQQVETRTQELSQTLTRLKNAQGDLVKSEKMAVLGQLVAGVAHEINTPLGAMQASIDNIQSVLNHSLEKLPQVLHQLPSDRLADFSALLSATQVHQGNFSFQEERQLKRKLKAVLVAQGFPESAALAATLSKMGIETDLSQFKSLLGMPNSTDIVAAAHQLFVIKNNSANIKLAVDRATQVVSALKRYSHQGPVGQPQEAHIAQTIDTALVLYQHQLKQTVDLHKLYEPISPILCYPEELIQVWSNLISNALHAMNNQGLLKIRITDAEPFILVEFIDSGIGIPKEIKARIFEPFFTTKAVGKGSGLGLDIVRKTIVKHQGHIEVNSQAGGTTFKVYLSKHLSL
jgi:C4-dicarboxylate-specific signal transduction histidine kinase